MKNWIIAASAFMLTALVAPQAAPLQTQDIEIVRETPQGRIAWPIKAEIADNDETRAYGFMNRQKIPPSTGMLFVYPQPMVVKMWMKNTLVSLDMLFFDATGKVVFIKERAQPGDLTPQGPDDEVCAALEVAGGEVKRLGFKTGDRLGDTKLLEPCAKATYE